MLRRFSVLLILTVVIFGCAKKSTEWNDNPTPSILSLSTTIPMVGDPIDLAADGDTLFVAEDWGGFSAIRLSDQSKTWYTRVLTVDGPYLDMDRIRRVSYVASHKRVFLDKVSDTDNIQIGNTTIPDTLKLISNITGGTLNIRDMMFRSVDSNTIEGAFCLNNEVSYGTMVGDMWMGITKHFITTSPTYGVHLTAQYVYVAAGMRGLVIFDRNTEAIIGQIDLPGEAQKVKVVGNYAYLPCRQAGLQIVNISDPTAPVIAGSIDTDGYATSIDVLDDMALVSSGGSGIYIFNISNPAQPSIINRTTSCGYTNTARFHNGKVIVAARDQGILIYNIQ